MLKKIFASRSAVEANHTNGTAEPVFTIREVDGAEHHSSSIVVLGPSEIRYDARGQDGSRVWIETHSRLILKDDPEQLVVIV